MSDTAITNASPRGSARKSIRSSLIGRFQSLLASLVEASAHRSDVAGPLYYRFPIF